MPDDIESGMLTDPVEQKMLLQKKLHDKPLQSPIPEKKDRKPIE